MGQLLETGPKWPVGCCGTSLTQGLSQVSVVTNGEPSSPFNRPLNSTLLYSNYSHLLPGCLQLPHVAPAMFLQKPQFWVVARI